MVRYIEYERIKIFEERRGERERYRVLRAGTRTEVYYGWERGEVWERSKYTFLSAYFTGRKRIGRRTHNGGGEGGGGGMFSTSRRRKGSFYDEFFRLIRLSNRETIATRRHSIPANRNLSFFLFFFNSKNAIRKRET